MEANKCVGCRFWKNLLKKDSELAIGECRFGPPELHPSLDGTRLGSNKGFWPHTYAKDWCGKHLPKTNS